MQEVVAAFESGSLGAQKFAGQRKANLVAVWITERKRGPSKFIRKRPPTI